MNTHELSPAQDDSGRSEKLPAELGGLVGTAIAACVGGLVMTAFSLVVPMCTTVRGASSSARLVRAREKIAAGESLSEGERMLLEEVRLGDIDRQ